MSEILDFFTKNKDLNLLNWLDWSIVIVYFAVILALGVSTFAHSGKNSKHFFLGGRKNAWWLLGLSMVATTFSCDTPNLVTDIVRTSGVAGNWAWWAFLLTGMLTVFIYSKLWRRTGMLTDLEFYELRYSGAWASFLRGFRALYLGVIFNVLVMATVMLAAIKIGEVMLAFSPLQTIFIASIITLIISCIGGFKGILLTDALLFVLAMIGSILAAVYSINALETHTNGAVSGLSGLINEFSTNPALANKLDFLPSGDLLLTLFIIPIAVQWWASYYPGAEPGGGGYIVQRMLAAKDEKNALGATLFFNIAHYALRPWPWIIVALCSLIIYPDLESISREFSHVDKSTVGHDMAYSAMLKFLPHGVIGIMLTSLLAAFMSTMSTQLNWGASYISHDIYARFINKNATHKQIVLIGRLSTAFLLIISAFVALNLHNAKQAFDAIIMLGAGTGLVLILRWFWWRINAICEFVGMIVSFIIASLCAFSAFGQLLPSEFHLLFNVAITTLCWVLTALFTRPTKKEVLYKFIEKINPAGHGWDSVKNMAKSEGVELKIKPQKENITKGIYQMLLGTICVYSVLFGSGYLLYFNYALSALLFGGALISGFALFFSMKEKNIKNSSL